MTSLPNLEQTHSRSLLFSSRLKCWGQEDLILPYCTAKVVGFSCWIPLQFKPNSPSHSSYTHTKCLMSENAIAEPSRCQSRMRPPQRIHPFSVAAQTVDDRVAPVCPPRSFLEEVDITLVGTYVMIIPEDDVTISGTPKDYEDRTTDSGVLLHRWFCENCGW